MTTNHHQSRDREMLLVGVDSNASSAAAVRWAAEEAQRRGARLHAVHVVDDSRRHGARLEADPDHALNEARQIIPTKVGDWIFRAGIEVELLISVVSGDVASQLIRQGRGASLVVVGRPDGPQQEALPATLVSRCNCPVAVVDVDGVVGFPGDLTPHPEGASHART
jgi:nucleotide-binding universal stress UspA family protein